MGHDSVLEGAVAELVRVSGPSCLTWRESADQAATGKLMNSVSVMRYALRPDSVRLEQLEHSGSDFKSAVQIVVCPAKGRTIGGCESRPGKPPEEPA